MLKPMEVANFFIGKSLSSGIELTPMKLVKLCYIAHGWYLAYFNEALLPEAIYAWKYGPVIPSVYHTFKKYYTGQITKLEADPLSDVYVLPKTAREEEFLSSVWNAYKKFDGIQLSTLTHQTDTPWDITWNKNGGRFKKNVIIPNDLIMAHYKEKIMQC